MTDDTREARFNITIRFKAPKTYSDKMLGEYLEGAVRRTIHNDPHGVTKIIEVSGFNRKLEG